MHCDYYPVSGALLCPENEYPTIELCSFQRASWVETCDYDATCCSHLDYSLIFGMQPRNSLHFLSFQRLILVVSKPISSANLST